MLTRAGTIVLVGSVLLGVTGRLLGILELFVVAAVGVGLVLLSVITVRWRPPVIRIQRTIRPGRVHAGTPSRVELTVTNGGPSRSPVLALEDVVSGTAGAHLLVSPIESTGSVSATYRLPTGHRGLVRIGPLTLTQPEPFGLARRVQRVGLEAELTVLPRVIDLLPLPQSRGQDPVAGAEQPDHLGRGGDDFYGLRPYVIGDDLRRVHWLSTARSGDLLVRQDEQPRQGRVTIVLDNRRGASDAATFETMVIAAASIVTAARRRGDVVRLRTTSGDRGGADATGFDTGFVSGHSQTDALMEHLAVVEHEVAGPWPASLRGDSATGTLVAVVGDLSQADVDTILGRRARGGDLTIVRVAGPAQHRPAVGRGLGRQRVRLIEVADEASLAAAWNQAVTRPLGGTRSGAAARALTRSRAGRG